MVSKLLDKQWIVSIDAKMKLIRKYEQGELTMDLLREHGITWIRGQRRLPESLVKEIEKRDMNDH